MKCPGCGEEVEEIRHEFKSVIHKHHSVKGRMKSKLLLHCEVRDVKTGKKVSVCKKCRLKLVGGMAGGGNSE